jgi:hypothetical protein
MKDLDCQSLPESIQSVEQLEELLSRPTPEVVAAMGRLEGDLIVLGVGGKIGPSLARRAAGPLGHLDIDGRRALAPMPITCHKPITDPARDAPIGRRGNRRQRRRLRRRQRLPRLYPPAFTKCSAARACWKASGVSIPMKLSAQAKPPKSIASRASIPILSTTPSSPSTATSSWPTGEPRGHRVGAVLESR